MDFKWQIAIGGPSLTLEEVINGRSVQVLSVILIDCTIKILSEIKN